MGGRIVAAGPLPPLQKRNSTLPLAPVFEKASSTVPWKKEIPLAPLRCSRPPARDSRAEPLRACPRQWEGSQGRLRPVRWSARIAGPAAALLSGACSR